MRESASVPASAAFMSSVEPASAPAFASSRVPSAIRVAPVNEPEPESESVPAPRFVSGLLAPLRPVANATFWELVSITNAWPVPVEIRAE